MFPQVSQQRKVINFLKKKKISLWRNQGQKKNASGEIRVKKKRFWRNHGQKKKNGFLRNFDMRERQGIY